MGRIASVLALAVALSLYYAFHESLWNASTWWDVVFLSLVVIPACFAFVWLALPFRDSRWLLPVFVPLVGLAVLFHALGWNTPENFCKLLGATAIGFWFLRWFEALSWVVLVAAIIPWVDLYSVWRGPTRQITENHPELFTEFFSFAFPIPGEIGGAHLGLPDLLFFALFLAAAARFRLRPSSTWLLMALSFGGTLALAVWTDRGFAALPLLAVAFLGANADLLWTRLRSRRLA